MGQYLHLDLYTEKDGRPWEKGDGVHDADTACRWLVNNLVQFDTLYHVPGQSAKITYGFQPFVYKNHQKLISSWLKRLADAIPYTNHSKRRLANYSTPKLTHKDCFVWHLPYHGCLAIVFDKDYPAALAFVSNRAMDDNDHDAYTSYTKLVEQLKQAESLDMFLGAMRGFVMTSG